MCFLIIMGCFQDILLKGTRSICWAVKHWSFVFIHFNPNSGKLSQKTPGLKYHITMGKGIFQFLTLSTAEFILGISRLYLLLQGWFSFEHTPAPSLSNVSSLKNARLWFKMSLWDSQDHRGLISCFRVWWPHTWRSEGIVVSVQFYCLHLYSGWWEEFLF